MERRESGEGKQLPTPKEFDENLRRHGVQAAKEDDVGLTRGSALLPLTPEGDEDWPEERSRVDRGLGGRSMFSRGEHEKIEGERLYWCGVFRDAPVEVAHLCGVEFVRRSETPYEVKGSPRIHTQAMPGIWHYLTPERVAQIKDAARRKIVRWKRDKKGKTDTGEIRCATDGRYVRRRGDIALGAYLWLVDPEQDGVPTDYVQNREFDPTPICGPEDILIHGRRAEPEKPKRGRRK